MGDEICQQLQTCIESAIWECLEKNPGIEKRLDWFTLMAEKNIADDIFK